MTLLAAAAATVVAAAVGSATGFGFALVLSPVLFALLDPFEAVTALLALSMVLSVLVLLDPAGSVRWPALGPVLVAAVPGLALGAWLLDVLSKPVLQVGVGCAVLAAVAVQARREPAALPHEGSLGAACAVGLTTGALTTSITVSGPPVVLWLRGLGLGAAELRASLAAAFLALSVVGGAVVLVAGGTGRAVEAQFVLPLVAAVWAGHLLGSRAHRRLEERHLSALVIALVAAAGVSSAAAGVAGL